MAKSSLPSIVENNSRRQRPSLTKVITDAQLLKSFLQDQDEVAFERLMRRHGPMVYGVCRRILRHAQDVEDAFQAAFLALARKAASITKHESVSGWLYMVAFRIAQRAKTRNTRRGQREKPLSNLPPDDKSADPVVMGRCDFLIPRVSR